MTLEEEVAIALLSVVNMGLNFVFLAFNTYLICFHIYLKIKNTTTFELIMQKRNLQYVANKSMEVQVNSSKVIPNISIHNDN